MKTCTTCKQGLPLSSFGNNKARYDGKQNMCFDCRRLYNAQYYEKTKDRYKDQRRASSLKAKKRAQDFVVEYLKTHPCTDCFNSDIEVLEFDHLPEFDKEHGISKLITDASLDKLKLEIAKCEVVCANCHRKRTYQRKGCYRNNTGGPQTLV